MNTVTRKPLPIYRINSFETKEQSTYQVGTKKNNQTVSSWRDSYPGSDVTKDFLVSHFHKFHQKWSDTLGYLSYKKLSVILKKRSVYDWMTDTYYIPAQGPPAPLQKANPR